jgi:hypothetical protein
MGCDKRARWELQPACSQGVARQYGARLDRGMQSLSVRVLGEFEVDGVEPYALGSRKGRALLRLLALARGQVVSADALGVGSVGGRPAEQTGRPGRRAGEPPARCCRGGPA